LRLSTLTKSVLAIALCASAGCQLLAGLDGDRRLEPTGTGGTGGTGGGACVPVHPPKPPSGGGGGSTELVLALHQMDLGEVMTLPASKNVGFDIDGSCTCPAAPTCAEPTWASASHCDNDGGRDNAVGQAFNLINASFGGVPIISSVEFSQQATNGSWSLLFRVRDYNDKADDAQVRVAVYLTPGLGMKPAWDGSDTWPITDVSLTDMMSLDQPVFEDDKAYVSGGVLVAHFPQMAILFSSLGVHLRIDLHSVVVSGTLTDSDAGGKRLTQATMSGAWKVSDLFADLSDLRVNGGMALCTNSAYYITVKNAFCTAVDAVAKGGGGPTTPCDALSFGMSFEAWPANLGTPVMSMPLGGGCSSSSDPKNDTCGP
jgi:hypothetical protein